MFLQIQYLLLTVAIIGFAQDVIHPRFKSNGRIIFPEVDRYLRRHGYLRDYMEGSTEPASIADRREAIKRFQHYVEDFASGSEPIYVTGECDDYTLKWMSKLRCGCEDMPLPKKMMRVKRSSRMQRFKPLAVTTGPRWPSTSVTWRLGRLTNKLRSSVIRSEIIRAFKLWSDVSALEFRETRGEADIEISFQVGSHGDGAPFDGESGVLAHAFYPIDGTTHFDNGERWATNTSRGIDFFTVSAHEFGHALGLEHSNNRFALMAPFYAGYNASFRLHNDDITRIQAIYGAGTAQQPRNEPDVTTGVTTPPGRGNPTTTSSPGERMPPVCYTKFEGITRDDNGDILAIVNARKIMRMTDTGGMVGDLEKITDIFPEGPSGADDFFNVQSNGLFFIRRLLVWKYRLASGPGGGRELTDRDYLPNALTDVPEQVRAAFRYSTSSVLMFGTNRFWMFDTNRMQVIPGSFRSIGGFFRGLPANIDTAFRMNRRFIYFFKDSKYYTYDEQARTVTGPKDIGPAFIKGSCGDEPK